ncbi:MAG: hypothetical protein ACKOYM_06510 [Actinomycetes bacterium]
MHRTTNTRTESARSTTGHRSALGVALAGLAFTAACSPFAMQRSTTMSAGEVTRRTEALAELRTSKTRVTTTTTTAAPSTTTTTTPVPAAPAATTTTLLSGTYITPGARLGVGGCPLFPTNNAFHASIGALPVRSDSAAAIAAAGGASQVLRAGFTARIWDGSRGGYPVNVADSRVDQVVNYVINRYPAVSDANGHVMPASPRFEGWPGIAWDRHLLTVDSATCTTSEAFWVVPPWQNPFGWWIADSAIKADLRSNTLPARGSAKASGFSMLHGLVRYDEVASGNIDHVLTASLPLLRSGGPVWPARFSDGTGTNAALPQMGSWFRLKAGVDISKLGPQARVVAQALRDHGVVIGDTGAGGLGITGEPDVRWNDADLDGLRGFTLNDFEIVDPTPMRVDDSLAIR